jgi:hypothetical protein
MEAFIIEEAGEIKEAFSYDRPLIEASRHALEEYARATYGGDAIIRPMTRKEEGLALLLSPDKIHSSVSEQVRQISLAMHLLLALVEVMMFRGVVLHTVLEIINAAAQETEELFVAAL